MDVAINCCWSELAAMQPVAGNRQQASLLLQTISSCGSVGNVKPEVVEEGLSTLLLCGVDDVLSLSSVVSRNCDLAELSQSLQDSLLHYLLAHVASAEPPTEPLYLSADLISSVQGGPPQKVLEELLGPAGPLLSILSSPASEDVQRACLRCVAVCGSALRPGSLAPDHALLQELVRLLARACRDLHCKLLLSVLRALRSVLVRTEGLGTCPLLPSLLTCLKGQLLCGLAWDATALPSPAETPKSRVARKPRPPRQTVPPAMTSSDSEVSEGEAPSLAPPQPRIRQAVHSCLQAVFESLDKQTVVKYWLSFLPDGPRLPHSPPSLLTCVLKDPAPKCRRAAACVLLCLLEGSKPYLAPAHDKVAAAQPFTPYSLVLGAVVHELHSSLLPAVAMETNAGVRVQLIKCLAALVANAPYHQLKAGHLSQITCTLQEASATRDTDVHVACLTCVGAVLSISTPLKEPTQWLQSHQPPWVLQHCTSLLQSPGSQSPLQTEALQVLTALIKFHFTTVWFWWNEIMDLYLNHLSTFPSHTQLHVLKFLEEFSRSLSATLEAKAVVVWQRLLEGPLAALLRDTCAHTLCAQAFGVLSTVGAKVFQALPSHCQVLALSLPLSFSRDSSVHRSVRASAVRVLGVFVSFSCLAEDSSFLVDCHSVLLQCVACSCQQVCLQASWALGNLTETLSLSPLLSPLYPPLLEAVAAGLREKEKVGCNLVRASGNILRTITEEVLRTCVSSVEKICVHLCKSTSSGSMKLRWNACYACHGALSNAAFVSSCASSVDQLLAALCSAVVECKNFKVRTNAALAVATPLLYTPDQFVRVWCAVCRALPLSEQLTDFSEYKLSVLLRSKLCWAWFHLLSVLTQEALDAVEEACDRPALAGQHISDYVGSLLREEHAGEGGTDPRLGEVRRALDAVQSLGTGGYLELQCVLKNVTDLT